MRLNIRRWLQSAPYTDAHLLRQAAIIQLVLVIIAGAIGLAILIVLMMPEGSLPRSVIVGALVCHLISVGAAMALVRRGALAPATRMMIAGLTFILMISLIGYRSNQSHSVVLGITVPMILAALLSDRHTLMTVTALSTAGTIGATLLEAPWPPQLSQGWLATTLIESGLLATLLAIAVIGICLDQFGLHLRRSSEEQLAINRQLEEAAAVAARNAQSLRRSEARFNAFINQSPAASWITDADGTMVYMSAAYYRLFDLPVGNPVGRNLFDLYPAEFAQQYLDNVRAVVESRQLLTSIKRAPRSSGGVGEFLVYEFRLPDDGGRPLVGGVAIDLSDQLSAERALRRMEDQYRLIAEHTGDLICLIDMQTVFTYVSPSFQIHLGYPPEQLLGQFALSHIHPDDLEHVQQRFEETFTSGFAEATFRIRRADDTWRWFEARTNIVTWHDGAHALMIGRDITERRQLQQQLAQAQKMESIGRLAGGVAHDFNNMLAVVRGSAGMIAEDLPPDHPSQEDLAAIVSAADRAAQLTQQLFAFSSRQINAPQTLNLKKLLGEMDPLLRRLAGARIEMTHIVDDNLWPIRGDQAQIEQILANLVINARDAMPDGGRLTIEVGNIVLSEQYARGHAGVTPGSYVRLTVSDTGVGMSEEVQRRAFEPFFTTKGPGKGTGLGLSTCYAMVQQHGGHIWIYSEPDRGTTVTIYLPRMLDAEPEPAAPEDLDYQGAGELVLIVDDQPQERGRVAEYLVAQGYVVAEAADAGEAIGLIETSTRRIDLLLTDLTLPLIDGVTLAGQIQARSPGVQVIFCSGYPEQLLRQEDRLPAEARFIQKPISLPALSRHLHAALERSRMGEA